MKKVVLIGSGHAHLEVLKGFTTQEIAEHSFLLISPSRQTYYSGLIPRLIAGEITEKDLTIDSAEFAQSKGFQFVQDEVQSVDPVKKTVSLKSGSRIAFDLLSINVGGSPTRISAEESGHTIYLRPFNDFLPQWQEVQRHFASAEDQKFVVVGGGAAAVEVAAALKTRLNKNQASNNEVHLVSKGARLCENYSDKISEKIKKSLIKTGIKIHLNEQVTHIQQKTIHLNQGIALDFNYIFIVTPTQPSKILPGKVDSKLRLSSSIFAVGDGTEMAGNESLPRSGVIAVRQGQHLLGSIRNSLVDSEPTHFKVGKRQLNILITGENSAIAVWGKYSFESKGSLWLKNWIDHRYMASFNGKTTKLLTSFS
jgi:selenide,water dikinase